MPDQPLLDALADQVRADAPEHRFSLIRSVKNAIWRIAPNYPAVDESTWVQYALDLYERFLEPLDAPGPDAIVDPLAKAALAAGVRKALAWLKLLSVSTTRGA